MLQGSQVRIKLGNKRDNTPIYSNLMDTITPNIAVQGESIDFTLGSDANQYTLATAPTGDIYIDGTFYESLNGGIVCSVSTIGTPDTNTVLIGGRIANISVLYNKEDDEVIDLIKDSTNKVLKRRLVYCLWGASLGDGESTENNKIQLSFVAWNDTSHQLENIATKAGDYKTFYNQAYNKGTLAVAQKEGIVLQHFELGGYAEDELLDLNEPKPFFIEAVLNNDTTIQSDQKVKIAIGEDSGATIFTDGSDNTIGTTIGQLDTVSFLTTDINKTFFEIANGTLYFNGTLVQPSKVMIKGSSNIEVDLSNTIAGTDLYKNDFFILQGVK